MQSNPKLSIIVPCYMSEKYLQKCLTSLVEQSLQDIEIICVYSTSTDKTLEIIKDYHNKYKDKLRYIEGPKKGLYKAREDGILIAKGDYIGFLDADDYVEKDFAEKMYKHAIKTKSDIVICGFKRINLESNKIISYDMCKKRRDIFKNNIDDIISVNTAAWNKIYKLDTLKKVEIFKNPPAIQEDMILNLLVLPYVDKISFIDDCLINYVIRNDSISNTIKESHVSSLYSAMIELKDIYKKNNRQELLAVLDGMVLLHLGLSLALSLSEDKECAIGDAIFKNNTFIKNNFPNWLSNPSLRLSHIIKTRSPNIKIFIISLIYKLGLLKPTIKIYKYITKNLNLNLKW